MIAHVVVDVVSLNAGISLASHVKGFSALVVEGVAFHASAALFWQCNGAGSAQTEAVVSAFKARTQQRKVVVVGVGQALCVHVHQRNLGLCVGCEGRMQVTIVDGYVPTLVAQVHNAGVGNVFGAHFQCLQRGIVGPVEGYHAIVHLHLLFLVCAFRIFVVEDVHISALSRGGFKGECIGFRQAFDVGDAHPLVVFSALDAHHHWSIHAIAQRVYGRLYGFVFGVRPHIERSAHALCDGSGGR